MASYYEPKIMKKITSKKKWEGRTQNPRNSGGKRMKNVPKTPRSERHLCFSHYSNYQYFPLLFSISIPISISKFPKSSISISKSIFWRCKFQYQYQNQYFEIVIFNIKININTSKITRTASGLFVGSTTTLRSSAPRREPRWRRNSPKSSNRGVMTSSSTRTSKKNLRA